MRERKREREKERHCRGGLQWLILLRYLDVRGGSRGPELSWWKHS